MTPKFSKAVDRIFLHVLGLLNRISLNETVDPDAEFRQLKILFDRAENQLGNSDEWQLAKYALAGWIDDMLIEAPWEGRQWWNQNAMEAQLFNSRDAYSSFYVKAVEAAALPQKNALEVFYVCVVLGFRGLYRDPSPIETEGHGLPPDVQSWTRQTGAALQLGQGVPPIVDSGKPGAGAPPLYGKYRLVGSSLLFAILLGLAFLIFLLAYWD